MTMITPNKQIAEAKGFTLIETLVAITILTFSIVATFTATQSGLMSAIESKNQVIGYYLAQEGVEYIRNMRDANALAGQPIWLSGFATASDPCAPGGACDLDTVNSKLKACPTGIGTCVNLVQDQTQGTTYGMYGTKSEHNSWAPTNYKREIQVQTVPSNPDEILVIVTVTWIRAGQPLQTFEVRESIFNWQS